jgi:hypothetical protein
MISQYLRKLTNEEYQSLTARLHTIQNGKCFICGQDIDLELHNTNIDHIIPLNTGGKDNDENFALTHESCNKSKQDANLEVARALHRLKKVQESVSRSENRAASLKDVLKEYGGSLYDFSYKINGNTLSYVFDKAQSNDVYTAEIHTDFLSGANTVFIEVPIQYLFHDELINPRGINSSINLLVKEFYKKNPQLHLSLARIDNGRIKIFDGQHKAVAQILLGAKKILVRLFIDFDVNRLTETNANAGSKLRQIAFDKAVMRQLNNTQYNEKIKQYQQQHNLSEDDFSFSEAKLCDYFKGEKMKTYILDALRTSITSNPDNKMKDYIDFEGKGKSLPLSHSTYDKVFLAKFIDSKRILSTPIDYKSDEGANPRELEIKQISKLLSIITEKLYVGKFNQEIGLNRIESRIAEQKDSDITDAHLIAYRMSKEEILYAWVPYIMKIIEMYFLYNSIPFERDSVFQIEFSDQLWTNISNFITNLSMLPLWKDRSMASTHFSGKKDQKFWKTVFETGSTPEGVAILTKPINHNEMILAPQSNND